MSQLRLHLNEHTGGCSPAVLAAIRSLTREDLACYPDYDEVTRACEGWFGVPRGWVQLTNGLDEGLKLVAELAARRSGVSHGSDTGQTRVRHVPDPALIVEPAFEMYAASADAIGLPHRHIPPEPNFRFPLEALLAAISPATPLIFLTDPNNPTGLAIPPGAVERIAIAAPATLVFLDEAYAEGRADVTPGHYVVLIVADTGDGMSDDAKAHLFEPFFTTKDPGKGTGLGLATCYAIARQFGGHMTAYSERGLGTTMKLYLPCVEKHANAAGTELADGGTGTETVLLVEDDENVRRLTARMLKARGYSVLQAGDGAQALEILEGFRDPVHLLLTDVVLPRMGGRQLAEQVVARRPEIRVLYMSGYSDDVVLQHRLTEHGVVLVQKPFTADTLVRKVHQALAARPTEAMRG